MATEAPIPFVQPTGTVRPPHHTSDHDDGYNSDEANSVVVTDDGEYTDYDRESLHDEDSLVAERRRDLGRLDESLVSRRAFQRAIRTQSQGHWPHSVASASISSSSGSSGSSSTDSSPSAAAATIARPMAPLTHFYNAAVSAEYLRQILAPSPSSTAESASPVLQSDLTTSSQLTEAQRSPLSPDVTIEAEDFLVQPSPAGSAAPSAVASPALSALASPAPSLAASPSRHPQQEAAAEPTTVVWKCDSWTESVVNLVPHIVQMRWSCPLPSCRGAVEPFDMYRQDQLTDFAMDHLEDHLTQDRVLVRVYNQRGDRLWPIRGHRL